MIYTYSPEEAIAIAKQWGLTLIRLEGKGRVSIERDWMPDGTNVFRFRAARGRNSGKIVGNAFAPLVRN